MPPRRPPTDLDLISVFKMLTPNEQLVASKMSPRCAVLVRAANRRVKTLVITSRDVINGIRLPVLKFIINSFSLASELTIQELIVIPEKTFSDYPMTTRFSMWNILRLDQLRLIDTATIEQIVTIFSAVTDLKFMTINSKHPGTLVSLLQHPSWQCQLTNLMVDGTDGMDSRQTHELITAINSLTALQLLALDWDEYTNVPDLSILAQLKTVVFKSYNLDALLRSLERYAADNADLKVHLLSISGDTEPLFALSQPLRSRIVCFRMNPLDYTDDQVSLLCSQFRSLTLLEIKGIKSTKVEQLFSDLSQLHQLIQLKFEVDFSDVKDESPPQARPLAQLNSLLALVLDLHITSHSQIEWLNLPWTMPNLKTIYTRKFDCDSCKVRFPTHSYPPLGLSPSTTACVSASLFKLHPRVDLKRIILLSGFKLISAEELLLHSQ